MRPSLDRIRRSLTELSSVIYAESVPLEVLRMLPLGTNIDPAEMPAPKDEAPGWRDVPVGSSWGGRDENVWFRAEARAPQGWIEHLDGSRTVA
ncbi:MAG: hypothetical protein ACRDHP_12075, partial [Ktedonobacterales bacterium]